MKIAKARMRAMKAKQNMPKDFTMKEPAKCKTCGYSSASWNNHIIHKQAYPSHNY